MTLVDRSYLGVRSAPATGEEWFLTRDSSIASDLDGIASTWTGLMARWPIPTSRDNSTNPGPGMPHSGSD